MAEGAGAGTTVAVYVTFPDIAVAEGIGLAVVEAGLAACVNILPGMRSIYRWKGAIESADEVIGLFKTRADGSDALCAAIAGRHPYDTPAIVVLPIGGGSGRYLDWILAETSAPG